MSVVQPFLSFFLSITPPTHSLLLHFHSFSLERPCKNFRNFASVPELLQDLLDLFITVWSYTAGAFNDGVNALCLDECSLGRGTGWAGEGDWVGWASPSVSINKLWDSVQ